MQDEQSDDKSLKPLLKKNLRGSLNNSQLTVEKYSSVSSKKKITKGGGEISDSSIDISKSQVDYSKSSKRITKSETEVYEDIILPYHLRDHPLLTQENLRKYKTLFNSVDVDRGGAIDVIELSAMLEKVGVKMTDIELKEIMKDYDDNSTGTIDFIEFVQLFTKLMREKN